MVEPSHGSAGGPSGRGRPDGTDEVDEPLDAVPDPWGVPSVVHLRARGTSLLLAAHGSGLPRVLHWGGDLGELTVDETDALAGALAAARGGGTRDARGDAGEETEGDGSGDGTEGDRQDDGAGMPLLSAARPDGLVPGLSLREVDDGVPPPVPVLVRTRISLSVTASGHHRLRVRAADTALGVAVEVAAEVDRAGVLRLRAAATVEPGGACRLGGLHLVLPVPAAGRQVLVDVGGRLRPEASRRGVRGAGAGDVRPSEVVGAAVVQTAGSTSEELWALAATTASRRSEARRGVDPLVRVLRAPGGGLLLSGGEDARAGRGETAWTTPLLVAAHGRSWEDVRARLSVAGRATAG